MEMNCEESHHLLSQRNTDLQIAYAPRFSADNTDNITVIEGTGREGNTMLIQPWRRDGGRRQSRVSSDIARRHRSVHAQLNSRIDVNTIAMRPSPWETH